MLVCKLRRCMLRLRVGMCGGLPYDQPPPLASYILVLFFVKFYANASLFNEMLLCSTCILMFVSHAVQVRGCGERHAEGLRTGRGAR